MVIGPATNAQLLEIGVVETDDQDYVIHAMPARDRYLAMIDQPKVIDDEDNQAPPRAQRRRG
jgi:hypothetical protein